MRTRGKSPVALTLSLLSVASKITRGARTKRVARCAYSILAFGERCLTCFRLQVRSCAVRDLGESHGALTQAQFRVRRLSLSLTLSLSLFLSLSPGWPRILMLARRFHVVEVTRYDIRRLQW